MIKRFYNLKNLVRRDKVLVIYGPRQVGKTTMVENFLDDIQQGKRVRYVTGNDINVIEYLSASPLKKVQEFVAGYDMLIIDEAQKIPHIGETLKLINDKITTLEVIVTGSASFELAGQVGEPLTGRKRTITLYPVSQLELSEVYNTSELQEDLESFLIYGAYPEVMSAGYNTEEKQDILNELVSSYLLKDILEFDKIKNAKVLRDLLKLIAFQIGGEVSHNELGNTLDIDKKTVARYLDLLEKSFVLYNLRGYSGNLRKEITKKSKYYFYDLGVRNALIGNFNILDMRNDVGQLWENFLVMERIKRNAYKKQPGNIYFWRTWDGQEVDFVEERGGILHGYEFKWNDKKKTKMPKDWLGSYDNATYQIIDKNAYMNFVVDE